METFEDILEKLLQACEGLEDAEIPTTLEKLAETEGLDAEQIDFLLQTFGLIDASEEKYADLQLSRAEGKGRREWMTEQLGQMLDGRSEEEVESVMAALEKGMEQSLEDSLVNLETELGDNEDTNEPS